MARTAKRKIKRKLTLAQIYRKAAKEKRPTRFSYDRDGNIVGVYVPMKHKTKVEQKAASRAMVSACSAGAYRQGVSPTKTCGYRGLKPSKQAGRGLAYARWGFPKGWPKPRRVKNPGYNVGSMRVKTFMDEDGDWGYVVYDVGGAPLLINTGEPSEKIAAREGKAEARFQAEILAVEGQRPGGVGKLGVEMFSKENPGSDYVLEARHPIEGQYEVGTAKSLLEAKKKARALSSEHGRIVIWLIGKDGEGEIVESVAPSKNPRQTLNRKRSREMRVNNPLGLHLIKFPAGTWGFVGSVPSNLAYVTKEGKRPTTKQFEEARSFGPRLVGVKTRSWKTKAAALRAAKAEGYDPEKVKGHGLVSRASPKGKTKKNPRGKTKSMKRVTNVRSLVARALE